MSQARGWSAFRDGLVNLSAVDPEWVAARLAPTGVYQTWFLFRRVTILARLASKRSSTPRMSSVRATPAILTNSPPVGGPDGPSSLLRLRLLSDAAIPWWIKRARAAHLHERTMRRKRPASGATCAR